MNELLCSFFGRAFFLRIFFLVFLLLFCFLVRMLVVLAMKTDRVVEGTRGLERSEVWKEVRFGNLGDPFLLPALLLIGQFEVSLPCYGVSV